MSANGPPRITLESIVVHDAKRRLRLVMELLEQEWRRRQTHGAIDLQKMNRKFRTGFHEHTGVSLKEHVPNNPRGGYTRVH